MADKNYKLIDELRDDLDEVFVTFFKMHQSLETRELVWILFNGNMRYIHIMIKKLTSVIADEEEQNHFLRTCMNSFDKILEDVRAELQII